MKLLRLILLAVIISPAPIFAQEYNGEIWVGPAIQILATDFYESPGANSNTYYHMESPTVLAQARMLFRAGPFVSIGPVIAVGGASGGSVTKTTLTYDEDWASIKSKQQSFGVELQIGTRRTGRKGLYGKLGLSHLTSKDEYYEIKNGVSSVSMLPATRRGVTYLLGGGFWFRVGRGIHFNALEVSAGKPTKSFTNKSDAQRTVVTISSGVSFSILRKK